jgi:DNA-binding transcriptional MerR regulator
MNEATTEWLTAAECALRTGLTVRALRVYENYGLIAPGRSAAGWRRYGPQELLKLNEIGLLKVLGLTLNQIRDLTRRPSSPGCVSYWSCNWTLGNIAAPKLNVARPLPRLR